MAADKKSKSGGGKLTRTETVTVRLDPKLRYLAELAARKQRRTVSSFIEWAIEDALKRIRISESKNKDGSIHDEALTLWDVDDADRFAKLALNFPELLTHDEQVLWKLVCENNYLWRGRDNDGEWVWGISEKALIVERLRCHWDKFNSVARGEADIFTLPTRGGKYDEDIPPP
jgi:predicted transcriptional regulator